MTVSGLRYGHQIAAWDDPLSFGVQALIEYNGLVMNDRYQEDRIRFTKIVGLDDADSSDNREPAPGDHGEFAYDAFYRGRTFVMNGDIQAGSLPVLKRLERDFKAAFAPLVEAPMKFRWFDVSDNFNDAASIAAAGNYTALSGSLGSYSAQGGLLNLGGNVFLARTSEKRAYGDSQQTAQLVVGSIGTNNVLTLAPKLKDANNYISCAYNQVSGTPTITISSVIAGVTTQLATLTIPAGQRPVAGKTIWVRSRIEGDLVTVELWTTRPTENSIPSSVVTAWLSGSDSDLLGEGILSSVGFGSTAADTRWYLRNFLIESLAPGDVAFNVRKLGKLSLTDSQDSPTRFKRTFQLTMRASKFVALSATQFRSQILVPTGSVTPPALGRVYPRTYPVQYRRYLTNTIAQNNIINVVNRGTVFVKPILVFYGATTGAIIYNLTNGQQMSWNGTLVDGDYLVFDCQAKTVVNSLGQNVANFFVPTSQWIQLEPGPNDLYVSGGAYSSNTKVVVYGRHGYL